MSTRSSSNPASLVGYIWSGDLADVRVDALYAACHSLRFTGRLELKDDHHEAQIVFVGGDPIEISGGDTQVIALWNAGQFRAVQSIPNLSGELTGQIEQSGSLAITKAPRLLAWVSEYRLGCEMSIERPGEKANLVFKNGQLESAMVNGKPELGALARVQAWTDGYYSVCLRPLFPSGVIALAPPPLEGAAPAARTFDLSKMIPLDIKQLAASTPAPPEILTIGDAVDESIAAERKAMRDPIASRMSSIPEITALQPDAAPVAGKPAPRQRSSAMGIFVFVFVLLGGAVGAAYFLHLPPFEAPAPVAEKPVAEKPAVEKPVVEKPAVEKPVVEKPVVEKPVVEKPVVEAPVVEKPAPPIDPASLEPTVRGEPTTPASAPLDARLIEKGRLLMMDGHPHSALSLFRKAESANPKNALAKTLQQQALGKLGRAELQIEGKGRISVNGKTYVAPKKLHLFAGPHAIDTGNGDAELILKKGERKTVRAQP